MTACREKDEVNLAKKKHKSKCHCTLSIVSPKSKASMNKLPLSTTAAAAAVIDIVVAVFTAAAVVVVVVVL